MPRLISAKVLGYFLILAVLDVSVIPAIHLGAARPILLYLVVIYAGFEWHWTKTLPVTVGVGLVRDFLSSQLFGIEAASLVTVSFGFNFFIQKVQTSGLGVRMVGTFLFVFLTLNLTIILQDLLGKELSLTGALLSSYFLSALLTALLMPFFFMLTRRWFQERHPLRSYSG